VSVHIVESESLLPTDPRDYRWGKLLGSTMVVVGAVFVFVLVVVTMGSVPRASWVSAFGAMIVPALLILTGLLVLGRAKLGLWLMYLLTADFVVSFARQVVHAFRTNSRDDIYDVFLGTILLSFWMCFVRYLHNRRRMFTGIWRSPEANKNHSVAARNPTH
jgi:hypothetical protein